MPVVSMSKQEFSRLEVLSQVQSGRLTVDAASALMTMGRRQVYRLRHAFESGGPAALVFRHRGRLGNHRHGYTSGARF